MFCFFLPNAEDCMSIAQSLGNVKVSLWYFSVLLEVAQKFKIDSIYIQYPFFFFTLKRNQDLPLVE